MSPTPYRLIEAQHGEGCDLDEYHHWVTLKRRGARFHVRQCASCYTIDYADLDAQAAAEAEFRWACIVDAIGVALRTELLAALK